MAETCSWGQGTPSVGALVAEALRLLDDEGFAALTTRRLAARMGIHQPRIYRRIADRNELLGLVSDAIMAEVRLPAAEEPPREWLLQTGVELRRTWGRHPHAAPLVHYGGSRPAISRVLDEVVGVLRTTGLGDDGLLSGLQAYLGYVFGVITLAGRDGIAPAAAQVDAPSYPHLHYLQQRLAAAQATTADAGFRDGLNLVLEGIFSGTRV